MGGAPTRKRTEITIETDMIVTIRRRRSTRVWCRECGCAVDAVGLEEAGFLRGVTHPKPSDAVAANWHVCEGWDGQLLICLESLLK
ncbi:MAG TPA: hypothetical protein VFE61_32590 [Candidatus Sulfotelmatobacter sp.]|jgi:hypothetical protein|nr:hypothetical protein [Candidatus Sulfotelmatobacter sp.]